jgi:uncharacterized membrane protein
MKKKKHTISSLHHTHENRLQAIVQNAIEEETSIVSTVSHPIAEKVSPAQRAADWITWFSGSMLFL